MGATAPMRSFFLGVGLDRFTDAELLVQILQHPHGAFEYIVTCNVLHVVRAKSDIQLRQALGDAEFSLCDSQVIRALYRLGGNGSMPLVRGSDLTASLLERLGQSALAAPSLGVIGCEPEQIALLEQRYRIKVAAHYNPPMGFIRMPGEMGKALDYMVAHPADIWLLAVGVPQQELLAQKARATDQIRGMGLCIGASLDFLTGRERRAPAWLSSVGLEWLWRLLRDPAGKWRRYLLEAPRVFWLFLRNPRASDVPR